MSRAPSNMALLSVLFSIINLMYVGHASFFEDLRMAFLGGAKGDPSIQWGKTEELVYILDDLVALLSIIV